MEGAVKHVLLVRFKPEMTPAALEELIREYAALVPQIPPMKAFQWGTDVSTENMHQGFTHIFESTFDSVEGVAEYVAHPVHVQFAGKFLAAAEKVVIFDYKPTFVK